mmetsp:Transcript_35002/g.110610  ORF Transcript_35002/g.110610 Transcript_35002/m.110610 type:complete len:102 (+) Transcript_35002:563-868(+)
MVKAALTEMREKMQRRPGDVGSTEVQVGALTARISFMTEHLIKHKKDNHSRRGLVLMLEQRKKLLKYFRKKNPAGCAPPAPLPPAPRGAAGVPWRLRGNVL